MMDPATGIDPNDPTQASGGMDMKKMIMMLALQKLMGKGGAAAGLGAGGGAAMPPTVGAGMPQQNALNSQMMSGVDPQSAMISAMRARGLM